MKKIELTINGKVYEAHFGFGFIEKCVEGEQLDHADITKLSGLKRLYYSIAYGLELKNEPFMSKPEFYDLLDDVEAKEIENLLGIFNIAFLRSWQKKLNLDPKAKKEYDRLLNEEEKKYKPQKVATAAK